MHSDHEPWLRDWRKSTSETNGLILRILTDLSTVKATNALVEYPRLVPPMAVTSDLSNIAIFIGATLLLVD